MTTAPVVWSAADLARAQARFDAMANVQANPSREAHATMLAGPGWAEIAQDHPGEYAAYIGGAA